MEEDIMSDNTLISELEIIASNLNKVLGKITLDEAIAIVFDTKVVSADAKLMADGLVQQAWLDTAFPGSDFPQFTHNAVLMLNMTALGMKMAAARA